MNELPAQRRGLVNGVIRFCLEQKLVVAIVTIAVIFWGVLVAPFDWQIEGVPRSPVPVDAIPDIGENQQIVFTEWPGRSPQDIDDQISYPLTVALLGIPGVKDIRSYSIFGFSTIYVVFDDDIEFYWSRSRVLEKLNSLPAGTLPTGITPMLGPDATALGQVFWYTLEGRDPDGNPTGGWGPDELRSVQDFTGKYNLAGVEGVSAVASIGGFVREYQVDVNPDAMRAADVTLQQVIGAVRKSNMDVGARTLEVNRAEYVVRGLGFHQGRQGSRTDRNHGAQRAAHSHRRYRNGVSGACAAARRPDESRRGGGGRCGRRAIRREPDGHDPAGEGEDQRHRIGPPLQGARGWNGEPSHDRAVL
jgi:Cu(I)/Ag(I) efflux system membrane protein CusA/SilA